MKLIILDRDGVINFDSPDYIKSPAEWHPLPRSLEAIMLLNKAGYTVTVATNQSGIGRGLYTTQTLADIHQKLQTQLNQVGGKIDFFAICLHTPEDHCLCRKPLPGLLQQIADHYQCTLNNVPVIGDSYRDIVAAMAVNASPILVLTGNGAKTLAEIEKNALTHKVTVYPDLMAAAENLVGN